MNENINVQISGNIDPNYDYTPITMWGYFGYSLLFTIPLVGFILVLVFSFGGTKKINLRNFSRSYFCWLIVGIVIGIIIALTGGLGILMHLLNSN